MFTETTIVIFFTLCTFIHASLQSSSSVSSLQQCYLPNCLQCSSPYTCQICPVYLNCCQQQCLVCYQQTQCLACGYGFVLNNNTGLCYILNSCEQSGCELCDANNGQCSLCLQGYFFDNFTFQCFLCPIRCFRCTYNGACLDCDVGYFLNAQNQCIACQLYMGGCNQCVNPYVCLQCVTGYYINHTSQSCNSCSLGCLYCQNHQNCGLCVYGLYLIQGKCRPCLSPCKNCYGNATNCTQCYAGYYYQNGLCHLCQFAIPFCLTCIVDESSDGLICLYCPTSMNVVGNRCVKCPFGCQVCNNGTICTACEIGYYLNGTDCLFCNISHCNICVNSSYCSQCLNGFGLSINNQNCFACPQNCLSCKFANNQTICMSGNIGYGVLNGVVKPCPKNCRICNQNVFQCQQCNLFFVAIPDKNQGYMCQICSLYCKGCQGRGSCQENYCSPGTFWDNGICLQCNDINCFYCSSTTCDLCSSGYFLNDNGTCTSCPSNCSVCNSASQCISCQLGFFLNFNSFICMACPSQCALCNSNLTCLQCAAAAYLSIASNQCVSCPLGSLTCSSSLLCLTCSDGFYILASSSAFAQLCTTCQSPCLTCTGPSQCTLCAPGFTVSPSGKCESCPTGCLICELDHGCQSCDTGFALIKNNFTFSCQPCPSGCSQYHTLGHSAVIQCEQCPSGYTQLLGGECFLCGSTPSTSGCQQCDEFGQCTVCQSKYTLTQSGICNNGNILVVQQSEGAYLGACIGLGCLLMALIIALLYFKIQNQTRHSSTPRLSVNDSQITQ